MPTFTRGTVSYPSGTTLGHSAVYSCDTGYALVGGYDTRTCLSGATWSGSEPMCAIIGEYLIFRRKFDCDLNSVRIICTFAQHTHILKTNPWLSLVFCKLRAERLSKDGGRCQLSQIWDRSLKLFTSPISYVKVDRDRSVTLTLWYKFKTHCLYKYLKNFGYKRFKLKRNSIRRFGILR